MIALPHGVSDREALLVLDVLARLKERRFGRLTLTISGGRWSRGDSPTGKVDVQGNRVILNDASGASLSLARNGDKLYGMTRDNANGRATMLSLEKQESPTGPLAAAGPRCS